jgi:hypothetical protein
MSRMKERVAPPECLRTKPAHVFRNEFFNSSRRKAPGISSMSALLIFE